MTCSGCGHPFYFQICVNELCGLEAFICLLSYSPQLIEGQLDSSAQCVLCSLLWHMREMHALTSISVLAVPKGGQSLCSAAGQANTNSEVL